MKKILQKSMKKILQKSIDFYEKIQYNIRDMRNVEDKLEIK